MNPEEKARADFESIVSRAFTRLPEWIREKIKNAAVLTEDFVDTETVKEMDLESHMDLLGLYKGVPQIERENSAGFMYPDTIVLYRMPILEEALVSGKPTEDVAFETLWHEIAHHFGLSEEDVEKREREEFKARGEKR